MSAHTLRCCAALFALALGTFPVSTAVAASLCIAPSSQGLNATRDCDQVSSNWTPNQWIGFADTWSDHCEGASVECVDEHWEVHCPYEWRISASAEDPSANVAPVPEDGWLYVWGFRHASDDGLSAAEFGFTGTLVPLEFEAIYPYLIWDETAFPDTRLLYVGACPDMA
ncbi:hypothetical protein K8I85_08550, partial [bacterium]|nr:hypothetical protein [bacterium]